MKKRTISVLLLLAVAVFSYAQQSDKWVFGATIFNTGSILPGKIISTPIHPGFTLGAEYRYNDNERHGKMAYTYTPNSVRAIFTASLPYRLSNSVQTATNPNVSLAVNLCLRLPLVAATVLVVGKI